MSAKLKIIILLLFFVQAGVFYWAFLDNKKAQEIKLLPYKSYLENPLAVKSIHLSNYLGLKELPIDFSQFQNLEYLDLSNNSLEEIPPELFDLPKLKTLILANNKLHRSDNLSFLNNESIERLDLSGNTLSRLRISGCIACLQKLKYLNLNDNNFSIMPNLAATKLDTILFQDNVITNAIELDSLLPKNHLVKYLDFSKNQYSFHNFDELKTMKTINCSSINLSENFLSFPYNLFSSANTNQLKILKLSNCSFSEPIDTLAENNIDTLDLSANNMFLNDNPFVKCTKLKYLDLSGSTLYNFELMSFSLTHLSLDLNLGKETFLLLPQLETLSINGDLGENILLFSNLGLNNRLLDKLNLPNLKKVIIRNYTENGLERLLQEKFPKVEIVKEYAEEVVISEEVKAEFERLMLEQLEQNAE